jgi:AraC family transcriptional regulator of adaptative response / DNA-3-methyladenine glycosylase II
MIDVAHAAGFSSLRRFNDAVRSGLGGAPTKLRKEVAAGAASFSLSLPFQPPLDFAALLRFFAKRALPALESVEEGIWKRALPEGQVEVRRKGDRHLEVRMPAALAPRALQIAARVRRVFDLRADPRTIESHLAADAALAPFLRPGLRIPGAWDPFEMAVRAILGQQITVAHACALAQSLGPLTPEALSRADIRGMPATRARAIGALAAAVLDGSVRLDGSRDAEQCVRDLSRLPGIGDWTAQLVALRALGEPDAFPAADLGLCQALGMTPPELRARAESWRPWRGYAAAAIWLHSS